MVSNNSHRTFGSILLLSTSTKKVLKNVTSPSAYSLIVKNATDSWMLRSLRTFSYTRLLHTRELVRDVKFLKVSFVKNVQHSNFFITLSTLMPRLIKNVATLLELFLSLFELSSFFVLILTTKITVTWKSGRSGGAFVWEFQQRCCKKHLGSFSSARSEFLWSITNREQCLLV